MDSSLWGQSIRNWTERGFRGLREPQLDLMEKLVAVSKRLDPSADGEKILKKIRFLYYDLSTYLASHADSSAPDKLFLLRDYFFCHKSFQCRTPDDPIKEEDYLLHEVMSRRYGSPLTIGLIFRALAQHIHLNVDLVIIENLRLLKFIDNGQCQFIDILKSGEVLSKAELLDLLNRTFKTKSDESLLESLDSEQILLYYLMGLRRVYQQQGLDEKLMCVLGLILHHHSGNLKFLAERALLRDRLGQSYDALLDLKRYFSFQDERRGPAELVQLYTHLKKKFGTLSPFKFPFK